MATQHYDRSDFGGATLLVDSEIALNNVAGNVMFLGQTTATFFNFGVETQGISLSPDNTFSFVAQGNVWFEDDTLPRSLLNENTWQIAQQGNGTIQIDGGSSLHLIANAEPVLPISHSSGGTPQTSGASFQVSGLSILIGTSMSAIRSQIAPLHDGLNAPV